MAASFTSFDPTSCLFFAVPVMASSLLLTWRLWRFYLVPNFDRDAPDHLPYWIPCIFASYLKKAKNMSLWCITVLGHAFQFSKDPQSIFNQGQKRFGRVGRPYSLTIAGRILYVITDPQDFSEIYRNAATFVFDPLVEQVYRAFQLPEEAIRRLYCTPSASSGKSGSPNPLEMDVVNISHQKIIVHMRGQQNFSHALKAKRQLDSMMSLERICSRFSTIKDECSTVVSLFKLCSVMMTAAGQDTYFGSVLSEIEPSLPETFVDFDKSCWQIFYRPAIFWSKQLRTCKKKFLNALETYSRKPIVQRQDMPQFLQDWEVECRKAGLCDSDIATIMLIHYFGLNTNTPKACFWLFCHVLFNPELAQIIRNETSAAFTSEAFDYNLIESSQPLNGIWLETLRLSTSSLSFRYITQDFELKGLKFRKGNQVILNPRPLQVDAEYFGANTLDFDAKRFVDNTKYQRHPAFRPFGGGEAQCPGQQIAKQTALTFVAYVLHEFDVDLAWSQEFPRPSYVTHPGIAVFTPVEGDDLLVRLTERRKNECC